MNGLLSNNKLDSYKLDGSSGGTFPTSKFSSTWARLWDSFNNYVFPNDNGAEFIFPLNDGNFLLTDASYINKANGKTGTLMWQKFVSYGENFILEHIPTGKIIYSYYSGGNITVVNANGTDLLTSGAYGTVGCLIGNYAISVNTTNGTFYKIDLTTNTVVWSGIPSGYTNTTYQSILVSNGSFVYQIWYATGSVFNYAKLDMLASTPSQVAAGTLTNSGTAPLNGLEYQISIPSKKFSNNHFSNTSDSNRTVYKFDVNSLTSTSLFTKGSNSYPGLSVDSDDNIWYHVGSVNGSAGSYIYKNGSQVLAIPDRLQKLAVDKTGVNFCIVYYIPYTNASSALAMKNAVMMLSPQITV